MPIFMVTPPYLIQGNTDDARAARPQRLDVAGRLELFASGFLLANLKRR
jgi:hypothetical protein